MQLPNCPIEVTLKIIGVKWRVLILRELATGTQRFGQLKTALDGVSQKVLSTNLKELESYGLIRRQVYAEVPPRVEYSLTFSAQGLKEVLAVLAKWGEEFRSFQQK